MAQPTGDTGEDSPQHPKLDLHVCVFKAHLLVSAASWQRVELQRRQRGSGRHPPAVLLQLLRRQLLRQRRLQVLWPERPRL